MNGFAQACAESYPDLRSVRIFVTAAAGYLVLGVSLPELQPGSGWYLMTALLYLTCFAIAICAFCVQAGVTAGKLLKWMKTNCT